jgi:hypothetical protein
MNGARAHGMPHTVPKFRAKEFLAKPPHLFGRGLRERVLLCLAVNGPMHLKQIAETIGSPPPAVFRIVGDLVGLGLAVKGGKAGQRRRPISINRRLTIYPALERLLLAIDREWPVRRSSGQKHPLRPTPWEGTAPRRSPPSIFQSATRTRVLIFIAATAKTDVAAITAGLNLNWMSAFAAVSRWEREGIVRFNHTGERRVVSMNPDFAAAVELRALLKLLSREV